MSHEVQYDGLASHYVAADMTEYRNYVEVPSFLASVGDVAGLSVLDVACGDGRYTRTFKRLGAATVVGVDVSTEMISRAQAAEAEQPVGIAYHVHDVAQMPTLGSFDVVVAAYLLHYANDHDHMRRMCRQISANLLPGGSFHTIAPNPDYNPAGPNSTKYGFTVHMPAGVKDGDEISMEVHSPQFTMWAHYWGRDTYEDALKSAGLTGVAWRHFTCSDEGVQQRGHEFFADYLANPHIAIISAVKPRA
ncbi:MAG TPA: class I SAM-dependent methyltransferase [Candidatus Limnocylindrales bacterium]|nr:class I SAM-dependent methyltransferase [Candidatus Limnocylindrales bacterium]